jgi:hypothetical protein
MRGLLAAFYAAIGNSGAPPIDYAEMRRVTRIMDAIFEQCRARPDAAQRSTCSRLPVARHSSPADAAVRRLTEQA